jgi:hypothetical protein
MRNITVTVTDVNTYDDVEVDLDDVISELSTMETQRLVDELYDDGYYQVELEKELDGDDSSNVSLNEQLFRRELSKIRANYVNLTHSEIEIIEGIAKRF